MKYDNRLTDGASGRGPVGVIGLGYVGLPLAVAFVSAGRRVVGLDVDPLRIEDLRAGRSPIEDVSDERLADALPRLELTTDVEVLQACEEILICVPTPLTANREPDLGPLRAAAEAVAQVARPGQLVVLESTTFPGTTREVLVPILERHGLRAGVDVAVAFSPERVDPGRTDWDLRTTPKVVGGYTSACGARAEELYGEICDAVVEVSSPDVAEMSKLLENVFRATNIALVNELSLLCDRMGLDVWEVIDAAATKPYGFMRFEPGPGMGGHCLPVDPFYLSWRAREFGFATEFVELAGKINQVMPRHAVDRVVRALNDRGQAVRGARILLLGMSYKAGTSDVRESPALVIAELLQELGGDVSYHDPYVARVPELGLESVPDAQLDAAAADCDVLVVVTAHREVDHRALGARAPTTVDFRGATRTPMRAPRVRVVKTVDLPAQA